MSSLLKVHSLRKEFAGKAVVRDVNLDLKKGQSLVILGPSGSGKTTLLRCLAGLESIEGGTIQLRGVDVASSSKSVAPKDRQLGFVFQDLALWPHLSVRRQLAFAAGCKPSDDRVTSAIEDVKLTGLDKRLPSELSGGEQQRLALARALVTSPDLILLDEPLASLDVAVASELRGLLGELARRRGVSLVYVTHRLEEAFDLGDVIAVMRDGALVQVGTSQALLEQPQSGFIASFVGGRSLLEVEVDTATQVATAAIGECRLDANAKLAPRGLIALAREDLGLIPGDDAEVRHSYFERRGWTTVIAASGLRLNVADQQARVVGSRTGVEILSRPMFFAEDQV